VAEVYLNGTKLGVAKTGFTPFGFDLTPLLKIGAPNVLAVMVDNRFMKDPLDPATEAEIARRNGPTATAAPLSPVANPNLGELSKKVNETIPENLDDLQADQIPWNNPHWHPAHGGLYRNVRLIVTDPLHISRFRSTRFSKPPDLMPTRPTSPTPPRKLASKCPQNEPRRAARTVELRAEMFDANGKSVLTC
jgi:beta-galactosidase